MKEEEIKQMEVRWPSGVEAAITYAVQCKSKRAKKWVNYYSESKLRPDFERITELSALFPHLMFRQIRLETIKIEIEITQ